MNNRFVLLLVGIIILAAGVLDIKYKGLFFRMLPETVKEYM
ncbi:hypothetical protein SAMN05216238_101194 [Lentibacillus persicus]|uniref:Uncharacterized protein n=1 Tax=Lentibacillus persicus TaxID=640948 RepID=A0A1I1S2S0_9BACI|nr:hypothetical protein [Lentibacillus persicus]SFD40642.1 hypothetical protein SAMN05216238_101194 [Lentibacillus persicus]